MKDFQFNLDNSLSGDYSIIRVSEDFESASFLDLRACEYWNKQGTALRGKLTDTEWFYTFFTKFVVWAAVFDDADSAVQACNFLNELAESTSDPWRIVII